mmetsp:Transcript_26429/g.56792  ORF Transcript_26429/g.56792 Transcript_26429/m.56792 type:complete len:170 (-) Transcript_26429:29-538(-)
MLTTQMKYSINTRLTIASYQSNRNDGEAHYYVVEISLFTVRETINTSNIKASFQADRADCCFGLEVKHCSLERLTLQVRLLLRRCDDVLRALIELERLVSWRHLTLPLLLSHLVALIDVDCPLVLLFWLGLLLLVFGLERERVLLDDNGEDAGGETSLLSLECSLLLDL